ncbi:hypothetical protein CsatA_020976 [Cannabis sativa]
MCGYVLFELASFHYDSSMFKSYKAWIPTHNTLRGNPNIYIYSVLFSFIFLSVFSQKLELTILYFSSLQHEQPFLSCGSPNPK